MGQSEEKVAMPEQDQPVNEEKVSSLLMHVFGVSMPTETALAFSAAMLQDATLSEHPLLQLKYD